MPDNKSDVFSTSRSTATQFKRVRSHSSPESEEDKVTRANMGSEKVGDLTQDQLLAGLSSLLDQKLVNLATKDDLAELSGKVRSLTEENRLLREEVSALKSQEKAVMSKLLDLEGRSRRNNLIFKGLKWAGNRPDFREVVRSFCNDVLGAGDKIYVNRAHPLGKDGTAVIAHFPCDSDIEYVMMQTRRLKGTGYVVHRDFPQEVRVKRSRLAAVRAEVEKISEGNRGKMPIVFDHLTVRGCRFTWDDNRLMAGQQAGADKLKELLNHDFSKFLTDLAAQQSSGSGRRQDAQAPAMTNGNTSTGYSAAVKHKPVNTSSGAPTG